MNNKGFTLIELLISITLLSLLMFTGNYVYSQLASRWDKELGQFDKTAQRAQSLNWLQHALQGVEPYIVRNKQKKPVFLFIGANTSLLASTKRGIISDKYPEFFRISALENENRKFDLVYQAISTKDLLLLTSDQEIEFSHRLTLLTDLDEVRFSYFGWADLAAKTNLDPAIKPAWFSRYSGIDNLITPEKIKLTLVKNGQELNLFSILDINANDWYKHYIEVGF